MRKKLIPVSGKSLKDIKKKSHIFREAGVNYVSL